MSEGRPVFPCLFHDRFVCLFLTTTAAECSYGSEECRVPLVERHESSGIKKGDSGTYHSNYEIGV